MPGKKNRPFNKWIGFLIFICMLAMVLPGKRGVWNHIRLRRHAYRLNREIEELRTEKMRIEAQIERLKQAEVVEKIAREKYGMAKKNEKVYRIIPKEHEKR